MDRGDAGSQHISQHMGSPSPVFDAEAIRSSLGAKLPIQGVPGFVHEVPDLDSQAVDVWGPGSA